VPRRRVTGDYDQQKPSLPHSRPRDRYGDGITVVVGKGAFVRFPSAGGGVVDIPRCHSNGSPRTTSPRGRALIAPNCPSTVDRTRDRTSSSIGGGEDEPSGGRLQHGLVTFRNQIADGVGGVVGHDHSALGAD
jgi:hypothetical protein